VQMHFNDLELRIRNFAITILGALLGGAALTLKDQVRVTIHGHSMPAAALLTAAAIIPWLAFYFMDWFWYHKLLIGAVKHGVAIEERLTPTLRDIALTKTIKDNFSKERSNVSMNVFYWTIVGALIALTFALAYGMGETANSGAQNNNAGGTHPIQNTNSSSRNAPSGAACDASHNDNAPPAAAP
jgi:hypothetical protein